MNNSQELFERYQKALSAAGVGLWEWDIAANKIKWDTGLQKLYELPGGVYESDPQDWYLRIHPEDRDVAANYIKSTCNDEIEHINSMFRIILPSGKTRYIRTHGYKVRDDQNQITSLVGLNWDVTHESVLKADLSQTRFFLENIMNAIPDPVFVKNNEHQWIFANTEFEKLLGKKKEEFIGKSDYDFFPKDMADVFRKKDKEVFDSDVSNENEEKVLMPDGQLRDILTKKSSFYLAKNEKILVGVIRDITEKNKMDSRFRLMISLIDSSVDLFGFTDSTGIPLYVNRVGREDFGIEEGGAYFSDYLAPLDKILVDETIALCLSKDEKWEGEVTAINPKTKEEIPVLLKIFLVRTGPLPNDVFFGCSGTNLTDIKRIQKSLIEQSKMASLGEMAAAIAHEVNNPLMIIQAKAQMLQSKVTSQNPEREKIINDLKLIEKNSGRIDRIIRSLKTVSRNADQDPFEYVTLLGIIDEALEISKERFRNNDIKLHIESRHINDESHTVFARNTEVVQVLMNLLNNSFDAVKGLADSWVHIKLSDADKHYQIEIVDSGPPISKEIAARMMQPFFTTKPSGQGTGLGLSLSKQIIENHGGEFYYDPKSLNTRFVFTLKKNN